MRNEENDCIRYLMKEMDPSEELLMERAMMENEDLLIEVESMRQTLQKLDKLQQVNPPSHVTDNILVKASEHAENKRKFTFFLKPYSKYAVAAAVILILTAGAVWFYAGTKGTFTSTERAAAEQLASPKPSPDNTASLRFANVGQQAPALTNEVKPWVDRNNILRFEDQFHKNSHQFEAILKSSTQKLQLIDDPVDAAGQRVKSIHLTGTRK